MLLLDYTLDELIQLLTTDGLPKFKIKQIYKWLNKGYTFDEMSDLSLAHRQMLKEKYLDSACSIETKQVSRDKTAKFLFKLNDGNLVEGVLMKYKYGNTLCISTQVGCRMGCTFCASTLNGLVRNLSAGEILAQIIVANRNVGGGLGEDRNITNVVLMGCGEPLDNFDNVIKFLQLVNSVDGLTISHRNISISTCGLVKEIKQLADLHLQINLTVSLHCATQLKRETIMPIAKKYNVNELVNASRYYCEQTGRRVLFEYTLIENMNDSQYDADALTNLIKGFPAHVNLIRLNEVKERTHKATTNARAFVFMEMLEANGVSVSMRRQMGNDIDGACGQLRNKTINKELGE